MKEVVSVGPIVLIPPLNIHVPILMSSRTLLSKATQHSGSNTANVKQPGLKKHICIHFQIDSFQLPCGSSFSSRWGRRRNQGVESNCSRDL